MQSQGTNFIFSNLSGFSWLQLCTLNAAPLPATEHTFPFSIKKMLPVTLICVIRCFQVWCLQFPTPGKEIEMFGRPAADELRAEAQYAACWALKRAAALTPRHAVLFPHTTSAPGFNPSNRASEARTGTCTHRSPADEPRAAPWTKARWPGPAPRRAVYRRHRRNFNSRIKALAVGQNTWLYYKSKHFQSVCSKACLFSYPKSGLLWTSISCLPSPGFSRQAQRAGNTAHG